MSIPDPVPASVPAADPPATASASATPLTIRPGTPADLPRLTTLYLTAFSDALSHRCFPRTRAVATWWTAMNAAEFDDPAAHYLLVDDANNLRPPNANDADETVAGLELAALGPLIAYAKWNGPAVDGDGAPVAGLSGGDDADALPEWPEGGDAALATEFFGHLARRRRAIMGTRPHWYLEIVATRPSQQRRGVAGRLLRWGTARADAMAVECYLEAGPGLVDYYARFGFEVVERFEPRGLPGHVECLMRRPARAREA